MTIRGKRTFVATAMLVHVLGVIPADVRADQHGPSAGTSMAQTAPGILPTGFGEPVDRDVAALRAATAHFRDPGEAVRAGYPAVEACIAHPERGAMGLHYTHPGLTDATLEVERPEVLVYERLDDGTLRLNGVEYIVPIADWPRSEPPRIMGQDLKRASALGIWYLHVWNWTANPSGLFADWNPDVKCRE